MLHNRNDRQQRPAAVNAGEQGQALAEFALTFALLVALLVGIILVAWAGFTYFSLASAARMGARHLMTYPTEPEDPGQFADVDSETKYIVREAMPYLDGQRANIIIEPQPAASRLVGGIEPLYISVQITYPLNNPTISIPYIVRSGSMTLLPPLILQATSRMRLD
jgi:hypothetical protein